MSEVLFVVHGDREWGERVWAVARSTLASTWLEDAGFDYGNGPWRGSLEALKAYRGAGTKPDGRLDWNKIAYWDSDHPTEYQMNS